MESFQNWDHDPKKSRKNAEKWRISLALGGHHALLSLSGQGLESPTEQGHAAPGGEWEWENRGDTQN